MTGMSVDCLIPDLPPAYELVVRDVADSARAEAGRLARSGADEGTLVWVKEQTGARDNDGRLLHCPPGNLYACLVVRPEHLAEVALQLNYVAVVSLCAAIAELVPPMTELRYRWPNRLLLNRGIVAGVTLDSRAASHGMLDWLLLGVTVNIADQVEACAPGFTSLAAEAIDEVSVAATLEGFSRQFLSWINRWAADGFAPVRRHWMQRAQDLGEATDLNVGEAMLRGKITALDEKGAVTLDSGAGRCCLGMPEYAAVLTDMSRPVWRSGERA
jgi:BirA family biotin operon repressor/biotin-[acetyl-CoA-carboxylase] ligase